MKLSLHALALTTIITAQAITTASAQADWRTKALELATAEQKVHEATWSQEESLWVSMNDDGTSRDGFASYLCLVLNEAGRPQGEFIAVTAWDKASMATASPKQLGKAYCQ